MVDNILFSDFVKFLKNLTINDISLAEEADVQYQSLSKLNLEYGYNSNITILIILNSLVCYQLSGKGEDYWREFSLYIHTNKLKDLKNISLEAVRLYFILFLKQSKNNKRLLNTKINRIEKINLEKLENIINSFFISEDFLEFNKALSILLKQDEVDKTILFTTKIFYFWIKISYNMITTLPLGLYLPIDSRLTKIFQKFSKKQNLSKKEYIFLMKSMQDKLPHSLLLYDSILWNSSFL